MDIGQKDGMDICSYIKKILWDWTSKNLSTIHYLTKQPAKVVREDADCKLSLEQLHSRK